MDLPFPTSPLDPYAPTNDQPLLLPSSEVREPYLPSRDFYLPTQLPCVADQTLHSNARLKRSDITSPLRLSPVTLQLLTDAHRVLSEETNRLGVAAADLFRRCQRMQAELGEQVRRVREIRERAEDVGGQDKVDGRIRGVRDRDEKLRKRVDEVRRKVAGLQGGVMSKREEAWGREAKEVEDSLEKALEERVKKVRTLKEEVLEKSKEVKAEERRDEGRGVSSEMRKKKLDQVMLLLERETALVEAVGERLGRLSGLGGR